MKLAPLIERHPYRFVAIMEAMVVVVYLLAGTFAYFFGLANMMLYGLANLGLTLIVIILLTRLKWWESVGFTPLRQRSDLLYFLIPLIPAILNLIPGAQIESFAQVSAVFAVALAVAFAEETDARQWTTEEPRISMRDDQPRSRHRGWRSRRALYPTVEGACRKRSQDLRLHRESVR